ncbi:hypothetical protein GTQ43_37945 [Nostoc sp. KVJ3]|uniref:hypothetical protein n=1 Tax=Nostoc sp. KVJ3 TaxID=457945 RepID=UPI00223718CF|nr:hypothetical protein [Nostoc sp. KVJ3]MCW5319176.1 hypothetical protein [Nostoc sp. KVJ3]
MSKNSQSALPEASIEIEAREQGAISWGEGTERGIRPQLNENHLTEVGDVRTCSAPQTRQVEGVISPSEESPTKSLFVEIESQDFAAMNGAKTSQANDSIQPEQNPAPEEIVTARTVSQSPLLKMGVVALICLLFVALIGAMLGNSMNVLKFSKGIVQPPKEKEQTPLAEPENETGKDKTALALTSQNYELKQIRDRLPSPTPTPSPTPSAIAPVIPPMQPVQRGNVLTQSPGSRQRPSLYRELEYRSPSPKLPSQLDNLLWRSRNRCQQLQAMPFMLIPHSNGFSLQTLAVSGVQSMNQKARNPSRLMELKEVREELHKSPRTLALITTLFAYSLAAPQRAD